MRASHLPYAAAFRHTVTPNMPESLRGYAQALVAMSRAAHHRTSSRSPRAPLRDESRFAAATPPGRRALTKQSSARLAVAFLLGVFISGAGMQFWPGVGNRPSDDRRSWLAEAAYYQALYTRDTVADAVVDDKQALQTVDDINRDDGLPISIPDLSREGLSLKQVQRLRFRGKPLVQIVYLPRQGAPIALCVMQDPKADAAPHEQKVDAMSVVTWRHNKLTYALIGESGEGNLPAIAQRLAANDVEPLIKPSVAPGTS
jgi:anti-sigma factor RsiW